MVLAYGICTLVNVLIANSTSVDLVFQIASSCEVAANMIAYTQQGLYHDRHPINEFLPLAIKVFGCLHQQAYDFLH
jgi:hypothetical protein